MQIGPIGEKFFAARQIDLETAVKAGVFTATRHANSGAMVADPNGDVLAFPSMEHGVRVNTKYRGRGKKFWQDTDGRKTFVNSDALDDQALQDGTRPLVIVEGEIDWLTCLQCGFVSTVSVPDGAPPVPKGKAPDELEPASQVDDPGSKFAFMFNNSARLARIKQFVLAVDADGAGRRLAAEIVRRLGPERCMFVKYPEDPVVQVDGGEKRACKDLNEVLMNFGAAAVVEVLNKAKPYPVRGLYKLSDYPPAEELETFTVGWDGWGPWFKMFLGEFMVVSGIPGQGKTAWTMELVHNMAQNHSWPCAIYSPEMRTVPMLRDSFRRMRIGRKPGPDDFLLVARADEWIEKHFVFIDADPQGDGSDGGGDDDNTTFSLDWLIRKAEAAVLRHGIRILLIDPWNEVEHARERGESVTDYIARAVRALKRFARRYEVAVIVVAHPTKDVGKDGNLRTVRLYDIEGSATWYNKADHGVIVERPNKNAADAIIYIQKVRHIGRTGRPAKMTMQFDPASERFRVGECGLQL